MHNVMITESDYKRLLRLLHGWIQCHPERQFGLVNFYQEIREAELVKSEEIPKDIITMRSIVSLIDPVSGQMKRVQLVYPSEADPAAGKISVLTPVGSALLGNRVGSMAEFEDQDGGQRILIQSMEYQPESMGHFEL